MSEEETLKKAIEILERHMENPYDWGITQNVYMYPHLIAIFQGSLLYMEEVKQEGFSGKRMLKMTPEGRAISTLAHAIVERTIKK